MSGKTIHYCNVCDYKTTRRWDRDRHFQKKHAQSVPPRAPTTMSVDPRFQPYPTNHASHTTNTAQELLEDSIHVLNIYNMLQKRKYKLF